MKVLCIDGSRRREDIGHEPLLEEGQVYEVEQEVWGHTATGKLVPCYKLTDIAFPFVYLKCRFIPCSSDRGAEESVEQLQEDELSALPTRPCRVKRSTR